MPLEMNLRSAGSISSNEFKNANYCLLAIAFIELLRLSLRQSVNFREAQINLPWTMRVLNPAGSLQ
jgi:hypothetical protein